MCSEDASGEVSSEIPRGVDRWQVVAASVCGTSHQKLQQPCQDAHYWATVHDDVLVAAVADGASSAALGKVGATLAVCAAATTVRARHQRTVCPENDAAWCQWLVDAMHAAQATVIAEAQARLVMVRELATTLILVVAMPAGVAVAQIGDGAVVVGDTAGNLIPLTVPQHGEYPNETNFLIAPNALATAQVCLWRGSPKRVVAFSDGLQRLALKMPDGRPHAPFFLPFFHLVETVTEAREAQAQVEAFLSSQRVRDRTDDDVTLFVGSLMRSSGNAGPMSL
jgi:serine/threonine protein phosphatase PrpC